MNRDRLQHILGVAAGKRIVVAGDVMLDEFVWGKVSRISPEAPVPVVEVAEESCYPGGAANVARNLIGFVGGVDVIGLVGEDAAASRLRALLEGEGIGTGGLVARAGFPTVVKTRIIARQQQVVRVDRERRPVPDAGLVEELGTRANELIDKADAVIFEDYGKGLVTPGFKDAVIAAAKSRGIPVCVDPNPRNPIDWSGANVVKPNRAEAFAAAGLAPGEPAENPLEDAALLEVGNRLSEMWGTEVLLVTLGEHGMVLFERGNTPYHTPTRAREVFDVSGAGDTVIAVYTLAVAAGAEPREAAEAANCAAGIVVGKLGTATVTPDELLDAIGRAQYDVE